MKKKSPKKLELHHETLRDLSKKDVTPVQGAGNTVWCTEQCSLVC